MRSQIPSPGDIENILSMDAEIAPDEHESSHAEFLKLCSDGSQEELQESSRRVEFAIESHKAATKRLTDFIRDGTVPANL